MTTSSFQVKMLGTIYNVEFAFSFFDPLFRIIIYIKTLLIVGSNKIGQPKTIRGPVFTKVVYKGGIATHVHFESDNGDWDSWLWSKNHNYPMELSVNDNTQLITILLDF